MWPACRLVIYKVAMARHSEFCQQLILWKMASPDNRSVPNLAIIGNPQFGPTEQ